MVNEQVLYVGQAENLNTRWQNHHRTLQLQTFTYADSPVYIYWRECEILLLNKEEQQDRKALKPNLDFSPVLKAETPFDVDTNGLVNLNTIWTVKGRPNGKQRPWQWFFTPETADVIIEVIGSTNPSLRQKLDVYKGRTFFCNGLAIELYKSDSIKVKREGRIRYIYSRPEVAKAYAEYLSA